MTFLNLPSLVEFPSRLEDFKFRHILCPAIVYPTQTNIPQMKIARNETKYHSSLAAYRTSKLNVSMAAVKTAVIASNTQMFCSRGAASDVFVVSSRMRSKMLNADRFKAIEKQSMSSDAMNVPIEISFNAIGLQSSPTTFSVAAINSWTVVKRPWTFWLPERCVHCRTSIAKQLSEKTPNNVANV